MTEARWRIQHAKVLAAVCLGILTFVNVVHGFTNLATNPKDLLMRWNQQRYISIGVDPYRSYGLYEEHGGTQPHIDESIGKVRGTAYPPWSYFMNQFLVPPIHFPFVKLYFGFYNVAILVLQGFWAYRLGERHGRESGWLLCFGSLALYANFLTLGVGQLSIVVNLGVLGMIHFLSTGRSVAAGLMLALAMIKPHMGVLFGLVPLVRRDWRCLASCTAFIAASSLVVAAAVGESPIAMVLAVFDTVGDIPVLSRLVGSDFDRLSVELAERAGGSGGFRAGMLPIMLCFGALALVLSELFRHRPILILATIPGVIAQLWIYGRRYDHTNLFILVVALGLLAFERKDWRGWVVFGIVSGSLWVPTRSSWLDGILLVQNALWIAGLAFLLLYPRSARATATASIAKGS